MFGLLYVYQNTIMKTIISLFTITVMIMNPISAQQIDNKKLCRIWILAQGTFTDSIIKFRTADHADSAVHYNYYNFKQNGEIIFGEYSANNRFFCGNGIPQVIKAHWHKIGNIINIYIKGNDGYENNYEYDIDYTIQEITDTKLFLKRVKINKKG